MQTLSISARATNTTSMISLIVTAALEAGCETLYSEDLQHGQQIAQLRIGDQFVT